jgi:hypothetical protein
LYSEIAIRHNALWPGIVVGGETSAGSAAAHPGRRSRRDGRMGAGAYDTGLGLEACPIGGGASRRG